MKSKTDLLNIRLPDLLKFHLPKAHNSKEALDDLCKAISLEPTAKYYKQRAQLYKAMGQNSAAEQDLKNASNANTHSVF